MRRAKRSLIVSNVQSVAQYKKLYTVFTIGSCLVGNIENALTVRGLSVPTRDRRPLGRELRRPRSGDPEQLRHALDLARGGGRVPAVDRAGHALSGLLVERLIPLST